MLRSIEQQLWQNAEVSPDKLAVISGKTSATYKQLRERVLVAKARFEQLPFYEKGGNVMMAAGKQLGFVYAYFGAHLAGLRVVPLDSETNPTRFRYIAEQTAPICAIGFEQVESALPKLSLKEFELTEGISVENTSVTFPDMQTVADILFTTGTTGAPKGVLLSYANEAAAARNINSFIGNNAEDVELLALPISHSFGLGRLRCCLSKGQTLILFGSLVNVKRLYRLMEEARVTGFSMVPAGWKFLQKTSGNRLGDFADQLRYIEMGSAYFSPTDKQELAGLLPHTRVTMHYGLTEASRSAFMEFHTDVEHLDSVGKASPYTDIRIVDEEGRPVPDGTEGEIVVRGEHVTRGYLHAPVGEGFFGDYFRTGDWGIRTSAGYLYLKSRKKELINVGGKKVSPFEVEEQLLRCPGVADCACVGIRDPQGMVGEVVKAFVVRREGCDLSVEDLAAFLNGKLEHYKRPVCYEWIASIPKTPNGKIQRFLLPV